MKVLVTGATGFIGGSLIPELLKQGHNIIATGNEDKEDLSLSWLKQVEYIKHDINEFSEDFYELSGKPDKLIHLSWEGLPNYKEMFHFERNLYSSYFFIKNLVIKGLRDVTVLGTCLEYGMQNKELAEIVPCSPTTAYGLAKYTLYLFLKQLQTKSKFVFKWIRLFYTYGKGQSPSSLLCQLDSALKSGQRTFNMSPGQQLRDYLPVEKVAEFIAKIALQDKICDIINCCSGKPVTVEQFVRNYLEKINKDIKLNLGYYSYPDYEPMEFWGNTNKLKEAITVN